tara:strand:- start:570 stop:809 length:240 start_codon:yes stop_codon:yes gene_type:complete
MVEKQKVELDGEEFKIKKGALKRQLGVPQSYTFKRPELNKMKKVDVGKTFEFNGKTRKMTGLLKRRITLALVLMRGSKK